MATGFYTRVSNTDVSGNELYSYLTGPNVRLLEFDAATSTPQAAVTVTTSGVTLSVDHWIESAISTQILGTSGTTNSQCYINLGSDVASQASQYVTLFNLKSTNDTRTLRFASNSALGSALLLRNLSSTSSYVQVALDGTASAARYLFTSDPVTSATAGDRPGRERIVLLSASNLNSGSQVVQFNILSGSL